MLDATQMMKRRRVLADFGEFASRAQNVDDIVEKACGLVGRALSTGRAKILEIEQRP